MPKAAGNHLAGEPSGEVAKVPSKADWKAVFKASMSDKLAIATEALMNIRDGSANPKEVAEKALGRINAPKEPA